MTKAVAESVAAAPTETVPVQPARRQVQRAGFRRRLLAMCYDTLLVLGVLFAVTVPVTLLWPQRAVTPEDPLRQVFLLLVIFAYFGWFWTHGGQTLGMRAWRLRVVSERGEPIGWGRAALRFAGALAAWGVCGLGFAWALIDRRRRAWPDLFSRTVLVFERVEPSAGRTAV